MSEFFAPLVAYLVSTDLATKAPEGDGFGKFAEIVQALSLVCVVIIAVLSAFALIVGALSTIAGD